MYRNSNISKIKTVRVKLEVNPSGYIVAKRVPKTYKIKWYKDDDKDINKTPSQEDEKSEG